MNQLTLSKSYKRSTGPAESEEPDFERDTSEQCPTEMFETLSDNGLIWVEGDQIDAPLKPDGGLSDESDDEQLFQPIPLQRQRGMRYKTFDVGYALG